MSGPVTRARRHPTERELAWAAGLFEGEGTVTIGRRGYDDTYRLIVTIQMTDPEVISWFDTRWPGWTQIAPRPGRRKPAYVWTLNAQRAEAFLQDIEPFIQSSRVRAKVDVAFRFRALQAILKRVGRGPAYKDAQRALYGEMRTLNRRGVGEGEA